MKFGDSIPREVADYNAYLDTKRKLATEQDWSKVNSLMQQAQNHAERMQQTHREYRTPAGSDWTLGDKCITFEIMKKVYEYVAYYTPTAEDLKQHKEFVEDIILDGKLIADSEQTARTKVIRLIPEKYEAIIDKIKVEIRAFR